jgi:ribonucleoside-diphosphate reductase alpha chain
MTDLSGEGMSLNSTYQEVSISDITFDIPSDIPTIELVTTRKARTITKTPKRGQPVPDVIVDDSRDALLTRFGKATLQERYLTEDESYQDRFANCVRYYANDQAHAQRMYDYISKLWCIPATPILSNGGTLKGNLISCFLNDAPDSLNGIIDTWVENAHMGSKGGGIGTYWGNVRGIGAKVALNGKTSGVMSFVKVMDALTACISQGVNRKGAAATYLDITHPEILPFIDFRRATGGDPDKKAHNLHHGVCITDAFMRAVEFDLDYDLICPHTGKVEETLRARDVWEKLLITRLETGEPYVLNVDAIARAVPEHHRRSKLFPKTSNLCVEITLPTGRDHHGVDRTAICALFQLNAVTFPEWRKDPQFLLDVGYFMDNVLTDYIENAGEEFAASRYSALRERSIGVGVLGFHSLLQSKGLAIEGAMAKSWNKQIFSHVRKGLDAASVQLANERGACLDASEHGIMERFSYKMAEAPTASVSIICGTTSPGIDPNPANIYTQKTLDGSFEVKNQYLEKLLESKGMNTEFVWNDILKNLGSVQHLDFLSQDEKDVYKTSFEIDQRWLLELQADRTPYICQSTSFNLFLPPDIHKRDLHMLHMTAYKLGIKSLYYCRSYSIQRADNTDGEQVSAESKAYVPVDYAECLACS